ncbi:MAG: ABC transporter ATP-binding protein, partial [Desulfobacterales bacterium]
MRLLFTFLRSYPKQSAITLGALLFAGLIEGFGLSLMVPVLTFAISGNNVTAAGKELSGAASTLEQIVREFFGFLGLSPTIGLLLIFFVASMTIKAFVMLA